MLGFSRVSDPPLLDETERTAEVSARLLVRAIRLSASGDLGASLTPLSLGPEPSDALSIRGVSRVEREDEDDALEISPFESFEVLHERERLFFPGGGVGGGGGGGSAIVIAKGVFLVGGGVGGGGGGAIAFTIANVIPSVLG